MITVACVCRYMERGLLVSPTDTSSERKKENKNRIRVINTFLLYNFIFMRHVCTARTPDCHHITLMSIPFFVLYIIYLNCFRFYFRQEAIFAHIYVNAARFGSTRFVFSSRKLFFIHLFCLFFCLA